jgi:hypothetical protein
LSRIPAIAKKAIQLKARTKKGVSVWSTLLLAIPKTPTIGM